MSKPRRVRAKKKCCDSKPRCTKCPVVLKRLAKEGYAEREDKRAYAVEKGVPKSVLAAARRR